VLLLLQVADVQTAVVGVSTADQVYPRLIPVHRVQDDLQQRGGEAPLDYRRLGGIERKKLIPLLLMNFATAREEIAISPIIIKYDYRHDRRSRSARTRAP